MALKRAGATKKTILFGQDHDPRVCPPKTIPRQPETRTIMVTRTPVGASAAGLGGGGGGGGRGGGGGPGGMIPRLGRLGTHRNTRSVIRPRRRFCGAAALKPSKKYRLLPTCRREKMFFFVERGATRQPSVRSRAPAFLPIWRAGVFRR